MLAYENGTTAMEWLCRVFGFTEKVKLVDDHGRLAHGEISIGNSVVMLATPSLDYQSPKHHREICEVTKKIYKVPWIINGVLVYVDDVMSHYENARKQGALILSEPEDGFPGLRYRAEDLEGQRWMFMQQPKGV